MHGPAMALCVCCVVVVVVPQRLSSSGLRLRRRTCTRRSHHTDCITAGRPAQRNATELWHRPHDSGIDQPSQPAATERQPAALSGHCLRFAGSADDEQRNWFRTFCRYCVAVRSGSASLIHRTSTVLYATMVYVFIVYYMQSNRRLPERKTPARLPRNAHPPTCQTCGTT